MQFSDGQYRLFLEFYAGGNIVLTNRDLSILSLQRNVPEGIEQEELLVGLRYALEKRQNYAGIPELTNHRVQTALQKALDEVGDASVVPTKKKKPADTLRKALAQSMSEFPPMLIDHVLRSAGADFNKPISHILIDGGLLHSLVVALQEAQQIINHIASNKGYIFAKVKYTQISPPDRGSANAPPQGAEKMHDNTMYEDFQPFKPIQFEAPEWKVIEFDSYNKTVDEFFSSIEGQKLESRLAEREQNAKRKLGIARQDHDKRVSGLQQVQELNIRKAQAIEANLQRVHEAIGAINGLISQGMDWVEIARLIEMEQARHNVVAEMIRLPLKLYENTMTVLLYEEEIENEDSLAAAMTDMSESEPESDRENGVSARSSSVRAAHHTRLAVDIDLALSPWSNARQYYDQKKTAAVKEQKTIQSSAKALRRTEKKINADLKKGLSKEKQILRPVRRQLWFEKFHFFISSDGHLVLGGKDAQQNEILYKRYLKKGDVYVHADLHGAASVVIKNKPGHLGDPIPPSTLTQAGSFAVATSSAWDSKAVMSAWWVHPKQVSKTAPTGEYLTAGSFTITGEKNYLPPAHLLLGFGVFFRVSDQSMERHSKHRLQDRSLDNAFKDDTNESIEFGVAGNESLHGQDLRQDSFRDLGDRTDESIESKEEVSWSNSEGGEKGYRSETSHTSETLERNPLLPGASANAEINIRERSRGNVSKAKTNEDDGISVVDDEHMNEDSAHRQPISNTAPSSISSENGALGVRCSTATEHQLLQNDQPVAAAAEDVLSSEEEDGDLVASPLRKLAVEARSGTVIQNPQVRGKHGKRNKLKTKYANQDEEDRALALRLLGSAATQKASDDARAKAAKEEYLAAQKRRRQQHEMASQKGKEEEEARRLNLEEGLETTDATEAGPLEDLEAYVGTPFAGDEIIDALVVCGPWDAIGTRCQWRAKMQPGTTKKGKAVRQILETWTRAIEYSDKMKKRPGADEGNEHMREEEKVRRREGELLRGLREPEVIGVVPVGKVRVVMGREESGTKGKGGGTAGKSKGGGRRSKRQK